jgi:hypothetical protein
MKAAALPGEHLKIWKELQGCSKVLYFLDHSLVCDSLELDDGKYLWMVALHKVWSQSWSLSMILVFHDPNPVQAVPSGMGTKTRKECIV